MAGLEADPDATQAVYDRQAVTYDAQRTRSLFEARWLARFAAVLPDGARVLDLGCGAGEPIARWLMAEGFVVTGVDFSNAMLDLARTRWPGGDWREADMRELDLGETFDGIIAWDSFFHLPPEAQVTTLGHIARHLRPGGVTLITVGPDAGEVTGRVGDEPIYHASLSPAGYATALESCGLRLTGFLAEDPETERHTILMAQKTKEMP